MTVLSQAPSSQIADNGAQSVLIQPAPYTPPSSPKESAILFPGKKLLFGFAVALILFCIGFLFTARSVVIETTPSHASHSLSGINLALAERYLVRPGKHQLNITATGYAPYSQQIEVGSQYDQRFPITLEKLPGKVQIKAIGNITNDRQANLAVTAHLQQMLPSDNSTPPKLKQHLKELSEVNGFFEIPAGQQTLTLKADRYRDKEITFDVQGMAKEQELEVFLEPAWGYATITSQPSNAEIIYKGDLMGKTPSTVELDEGTQTVIVRSPLFENYQQQLTITQGKTLNLPTIQLIPAKGTISLTSTPSGANVLLSGEYQGTTPLQLEVAPNKKHQLQLMLTGYQPLNHTIEIKPSEKITLALQLKPQLGKISITSSPSDAQLFIDNKLVGLVSSEGKQLSLPTKPVELRLEKSGYAPWISSITPVDNRTKIVKAKLQTLEQAKWAKIPKTITANAQPLKLFRPGFSNKKTKTKTTNHSVTFTLGASRREAGRRANEVQRKVSLKRPFYFAIQEVTNQAFRQFQKNHNSGELKGNTLNQNNQPAVNVSWTDAARYCNWLSQQEKLPLFYKEKNGEIVGINKNSHGYRLPSEAEWAWIARAVSNQDNSEMKRFSWGDQLPPPASSANLADRSAGRLAPAFFKQYSDGYPVTSPVAKFPPNNKGIYDLNGNAAEWVHDFYAVSLNLSTRTPIDPMGPSKGEYHVVRGPSWSSGNLSQARLSYRDYSNEGRDDIGFRIARYVEPLVQTRTNN